jgi:hypothetical protein
MIMQPPVIQLMDGLPEVFIGQAHQQLQRLK